MAEKSDIVLEEDGVTVRGSGTSPEVAIEGGNHWKLEESDGDLRIGDADNMLKMGVALGGGGEGNARLWATSKLRLGSGGQSVLTVDSGEVYPHGETTYLGTETAPWRTGYITLLQTDEIYGSSSLKLGHEDGTVASIDNNDGEFAGGLNPDADTAKLGTIDNPWFASNVERSNVDTLDVSDGVWSSLLPKQVADSFPSLGNPDRRWNTVYADEVTARTTSTPSDRRLKTGIRDIERGLDAVLDLRPVSFTWREDGDSASLGLVAQDVADVLPEVVSVPDGDGPLGVDYTELVAVLVDAIQEQDAEREALEEEVESQRERIDALEERLAALEDGVGT